MLSDGFQTSATERAKNRVCVRRLYYKKLVGGNTRTPPYYSLELTSVHRQQDAQPTQLQIGGNNEEQSLTSLHKAYVELAQVKSFLMKENAELRRQESGYVAMAKEVVRLTAAQNKAIAIQQQEEEHKRRNPSLHLSLLTSEQCFEIGAASCCEIKAFRENKGCFSTGVNVFGWRDRHVVNEEKLMFSLDKVYQGQSVEKWHKRVNDNAVLYYYTLEREDVDVRVRAFILAMRVNVGSDYLLLFRTLDPKKYFLGNEDCTGATRRGRKKIEPHKENVMLDAFVWNMYEGHGDDSCMNTYGGELKSTAISASRWWHIEILRAAQIVESQVTGSLGLLQA
ncbi:hypothetical protein AM587_10006169 [Phytophthora nicotianae]|uniref:Uncharacterized protein n=1 Tax=Phytophthora nicotianae TaxID=4792 RepID=A0A0W8CD04_PHYNI|nr:hypothetical protein AM587_10006169 [Phytophthora nicotianae]